MILLPRSNEKLPQVMIILLGFNDIYIFPALSIIHIGLLGSALFLSLILAATGGRQEQMSASADGWVIWGSPYTFCIGTPSSEFFAHKGLMVVLW